MPHRSHPPSGASRPARAGQPHVPPRGGEPPIPPKSHRGVTQILLACFLVLLVAGLWTYGAVSIAENHYLRAHGVRRTATVVDVSGHGRDTEYLLSVHDAAAPRDVWSSDVRAGTRRNDTINLLVDPHDPSHVEDSRVVGGDWIVPVLFGPVGLVILWVAWQMWRSDRWAFWDVLYARYGRVPPR